MPSFSGKFEYVDENGTITQSGPCRLTVEEANLRLIPEKGRPLALDLGDVHVFAPGDYELSLKLYTGKTILLQQFGKVFQNLCHDLLGAYRDRLVQCLLLEDLEEIERFDGFAQFNSDDRSFSSPAELRLYKSNIVVLPESAEGLQWRLADIDSMHFDDATYRLEVTSGEERLVLTKLAKRTGEFMNRLRTAMDDISDKSARILQSLFPFLTPDQFQEVAGVMKEGRSVSLAWMNSVHAKIGSALVEKTVDNNLKPYFEILKGQLESGDFFAGFKFIRPEMEETVPPGVDGRDAPPDAIEPTGTEAEAFSESETESEIDQEDPVLHWFMFPLRTGAESNAASSVVAWESTSRSGRATYFFRLLPQDRIEDLKDAAKAQTIIRAAVQRIDRALVLLNFRREPIYLPDSSLETQERYRRYAIACRNIPVLRQLRASFLGRALHTSPDTWQKQVKTILAKA